MRNGYQLVDAATVRGRRGYLTYLLNESGSRGDDLPMFLKLVRGFSFVR